MALFHVQIDESLKKKFEMKVGKGNMGSSVKRYIESTVSESYQYEEHLLRKELQLVKDKISPHVLRIQEIESRLHSMEEKKRDEELERMEFERQEMEKFQKMKHDTMKMNLSRMIK